MMQQVEDANVYEHLRYNLLRVADPHVSRSTRDECERYLNAFASEAYKTAAAALRHHTVILDPQLCWYYISCVERHAGKEFWGFDSSARQKLLQVCVLVMPAVPAPCRSSLCRGVDTAAGICTSCLLSCGRAAPCLPRSAVDRIEHVATGVDAGRACIQTYSSGS